MNWHIRYAQQANWTRELRSYIFSRAGLEGAQRVLEVGCGTGAILAGMPSPMAAYGLDIDLAALIECKTHASGASPIQGDARSLPFSDKSFDIVYCHFLLLWVKDPRRALEEMKRVTRTNGFLIAIAEPDYYERIDEPVEFIPLGHWQTESLVRQGADPGLGRRLADLFFQAGITIVETGIIRNGGPALSPEDWEIEWEVIESDIQGWVPAQDLQRMKAMDQAAREKGTRFLHVPTYFAWGRV